MAKYVLKMMFEYGCSDCTWAVNAVARAEFGGYYIEHENLPISQALKMELDALCAEYQTSLDWDNPAGASPWTEEQRQDFKVRANQAFAQLQAEFGEAFHIIYQD